jgi:hypothetical protein
MLLCYKPKERFFILDANSSQAYTMRLAHTNGIRLQHLIEPS